MNKNIKDIVRDLIAKYQTTNPFEIVEALDGLIVYVPLKSVRGFYQHYQDIDIVYIDESLSKWEQQIVCSHELGHMILHKSINYFFLDQKTYNAKQKYEIEANTLAVELLISDDDIIKNQHLTKSQLAKLFEVDEELIDIKIHNIFITKS